MKIKQCLGVVGCSLAGLLISSPANAVTIEITPYTTQAALTTALQNSLLGPGVTINSITYTGNLGASGTFANGVSSGLGIDNGIVLTTGSAANITHVNTASDITGDNQAAGYAPLDALIPGYETHDATVVDINFSSAGGDLFFNYVFGSDEYNEWVHSSFNDVFGFFIDGVNIALVPGSGGAPVSVNNVNYADNWTYYKNNDAGEHPFEYDGFTSVLTASALGFGSGNHTITLAIADAGDFVLDSGVFIQAGIFSDEHLEDDDGNLPDDSGVHLRVPETTGPLGLLSLSLAGLGLLRRRFGN